MMTPYSQGKIEHTVSSLYLHFPYCKHLCNYCDFYKLKLEENNRSVNLVRLENYLEQSLLLLLDLMSQTGKYLSPLETIYFGGGTPSLWKNEGINFISSWFNKKNLKLAPQYEWTLEVDPGTTSLEEIKRWQSLGVNRFSVGIQTLNPQIFPLMDRSHKLHEAAELLNILSNQKLNFSVDFMLGLPKSEQFQRDIIHELDEIMKFYPSHISLYFLTVPKHYPRFTELPGDEWIAHEYQKVVEYLKNKNFHHYEVASFAKPGFESKHNHKYWNHSSVLALGPSATGFLSLSNSAQRFKWKSNWTSDVLPAYEIENLDLEALALEKIYLTLRKGDFFYLNTLAECGLELSEISNLFSRWERLGYCQVIDKQWKMTANGWLILDSLISQLLTLTKSSSTPS